MNNHGLDAEAVILVAENGKMTRDEGVAPASHPTKSKDGEHQNSESWNEESNPRNVSPSMRDDLSLIKILSFLGFCISVLSWIAFFSAKIIKPQQDTISIQNEGGVLDLYSHVPIDLYRREPQDQPLSMLPLSSSAVPSESVSGFSSVLSLTSSSTSGPGSSLSSLSTSTAMPTPSSSPTGLPNSSLTPISTSTSTSSSSSPRMSSSSSSAGVSNPAPANSLQVFQLDAPLMGPGQVLLDDGIGNVSAGDGLASSDAGSGNGEICRVTLMEFDFKDSFGKPFVGKFTPPACMGNSNTVMMNFTVQSFGRQFDRLATMYLGDTEVFRTSTAEPKGSGIVWTYIKDMSHLMALWKTPQSVIFDLPNQTNVNITGTYMTTLTATFFSASESVDPASVILPLSSKQGINGSLPSTFTLPSQTQNATTTVPAGSFPRNANRAIVSIAATGQGDEEFWWQNALSSAVSTYNVSGGGGVLFGNSSFREVQLWLDGQVAGIVWPFPVIFTGGIVPAFWSPMVGTQAFDLKEGEIDVTPWLGSLCDGKDHTFEIKVVGLSDDAGKTAVLNQGVGSNWVVSGKIFVWTDSDSSAVTTGDPIKVSSSDPEISISQTITQNATGGNDTLVSTTSVRRSLTITSNIKTSQYPNGRMAVWTQTLSQTTNNTLASQGNVQANTHSTSGKDSFLLGAETPYTNTYSYPLFANTTVSDLRDGGIRIDATLDRGYNSEISGKGASPSGLQPFANLAASSRLVETLGGTTLSQNQKGNATLMFAPGSSGGIAGNGSVIFGNLDGEARFGGRSRRGVIGMEKDEELWYRKVGAVNGKLRGDEQRVNGRSVSGGSAVVNARESTVDFDEADFGMVRFLGRNLAEMSG